MGEDSTGQGRGRTGRAAVLSIRFQADNDLKFAIVKAVRSRESAIDFMSAQEAGLDGVTDQDLLDRTTAEERVLITHDRRTMLDHFRITPCFGEVESRNSGRLAGCTIGHVVDSILFIGALSKPIELRNQAHYLPSISRHIFNR
jgi:hypothetical protein